jgi:hypothetical protein
MLLSCMIAALIVPTAYAEVNDAQDFGKRRDPKVQEKAVVAQAAASSQAPGMHFAHIPARVQPNPVPQSSVIQNRPPQNTQPHIQNLPEAPIRFQGRNQSQDSPSSDSHRNHDSDQQRGLHNQGLNNQGFNNNVRFNENVRFNNNVSFNNSSNLNHNPPFYQHESNASPHFTSGWENHYRMPYRQGNTGGYRVHYAQSWPSNYGWRVHGWREDYRTVDPYWFAVITSMAVAQAWSDAEIAQAINDNNLRQQLLYDADVRQQMINSGYPADQVDYPDNGSVVSGDSASYSDDQSMPPDYQDQSQQDQNQTDQSQYPNQYNQDQGASQSSYYPPPNQTEPSSMSPSSPLYAGNQGVAMPSGEQVANLSANKNALFFCSAGNKQSTASALRSITRPDMSVWKTMSAYNRCAMWASAP